MPPRTLLPAALALVALLAGAWWLVHDEPALPSDSTAPRPTVARVAAAVPELPELSAPAVPGADGGGQAEALAGVPDVEIVLEAPSLATGTVSGQLVDESGVPIAGEPVDLVLIKDPWFRDSSERIRVLSRAVSNSDGRFALAARPASTHELVAGGQRFPRHRTSGVAAGDELTVVLETARWAVGVVLDQQTGEPVPAAHVAALTENERLVGRSDAAGVFRLGPLGGVELFVGAVAEGYDVGSVQNPPAWQETLELELPPGSTIEGLVFDESTEAPIAGAEVRFSVDLNAILVEEDGPRPGELIVLERQVVSDELGRFRLEDVPSIGFQTTASATGFVPRESDRHVVRQLLEGEVVKLALRPVPTLAGQVVAGDRPVAGATLLVSCDDALVAHATSDAGGRFALVLDDWDGALPLAVSARDEQGRTARQKLGASVGAEDVVLSLVAPLAFRVAVTAEGQPRPGAHVAVFSAHSEPTLGTTDADGLLAVTHALSGLDVEQITVRTRYGGVEALPVTLELGDEPPPDLLRIDLDLGAWIAGRVLDSFGQPLPGARVSVRRGPFGHTDGAGAFLLGPVDAELADLWRVSASAEGFRQRRVDVPAGGPAFDMLLEPVVSWAGRVVDASTGRAPERWAGVLELESWRDDRQVFKRTNQTLVPVRDDSGAFSVMLPKEGRFRILVESPDAIAARSQVVEFDGLTAPPFAELLVFPAAILELRIEDAAGRPVAGYGVDVIDWERAGSAERPSRGLRRGGQSARSNAHGQMRFNLGAGGSYRIAGGGAEWLEPGRLFVPPGPSVERRYPVGPSGDLAVDVFDPFGVPLASLTTLKVNLRTGDRDAAHAIYRNELAGGRAGRDVLFETLPAGRYRVTVKSKGYVPVQRQVEILGGRLNRLAVTLELLDDQAAANKAATAAANKAAKQAASKRSGAGNR